MNAAKTDKIKRALRAAMGVKMREMTTSPAEISIATGLTDREVLAIVRKHGSAMFATAVVEVVPGSRQRTNLVAKGLARGNSYSPAQIVVKRR